MNRRAASLCTVLVALAAAAPGASAPRFRHERTVVPAAPGANRLPLDVALLAGARPLRYAGGKLAGGLEDLRLYDGSEREVGYLLIAPPAPSERWQDGTVLPVTATKEMSGFELDLGAPLLVDRLRLGDLPSPFLKRMRLEGSGDRRHWSILVADGTVFDLPEERLKRIEVAFPRGEFQYLRVIWDDRKSAVVPAPRASAHVITAAATPEGIRVPATFERRSSEPGKSRFRVHLPGAHLPVVALELRSGGDHLLRAALVTEPRLGGSEVVPVPLGSHKLRRAVRGDLVAADLRIAIDRPEGPDLDLSVEDGDNPALDLLGIEAELAPLPWIYFESPAAEPLTARFGDPKLAAPRYDLEAMRESVAAPAAEARWGEVRNIAPSEEEGAPAGEDIALVGAAIDTGAFAYRRAIEPGPPGLNAVVLDAAVLAHTRDLGDLRIADRAGRQIPYVVERMDEPLSLALPELEPLPKEPGRTGVSRYRVLLPYDTLPHARLVLSTTGRIFDRPVNLVVQRPAADARSKPWAETVASARWRHADPERRAPDLVLDLPALGAASVELTIDEGDNSPLPIARPRLLLPAYRLRFFRRDGDEPSLVYGQAKLSTPRYDLALLAPRVLGQTAHEIHAAPEKTGSAPPARPAAQAKVFWGALLLAVAVLLVIIVRLLGSGAPASDVSDGPGAPGAPS